MNRMEFMRQLESLLQNISQAEREEALQYYNEYFNDAGEENEQSVIEALGNPAKVAENIKRDLYGSGYGDNPYQRAPVGNTAVMQYQTGTQSVPKKEGMPTWVIVLLVILCVFASPAILGLAAGILGTLGGVLAVWFSLILAFGLVTLALYAVMVVLMIVGIMCMVPSPLTGAGLIGGGLVCGAIGVLFMMLTVAMAGIATPAIVDGIVALCRKLFGKKESKTV